MGRGAVPPMVSQSYIVPNGPYGSQESISIPSKEYRYQWVARILLEFCPEGIRLGNKLRFRLERVLLTLMKKRCDEEVFFLDNRWSNDAIQIAVRKAICRKLRTKLSSYFGVKLFKW